MNIVVLAIHGFFLRWDYAGSGRGESMVGVLCRTEKLPSLALVRSPDH